LNSAGNIIVDGFMGCQLAVYASSKKILGQIRMRGVMRTRIDRYVRDIPKLKTRDIGSSGINLCPTPLPPVP
jgi:hypothetical protein